MKKVKWLQQRVDAAQGRVDCDLILKNATYLDVFSCEWRQGELAVANGVIVGMEPGLKSRRNVDVQGKWVVPGFIDAHVHLESSLMTPKYFQEAVLSKGTTTAVCDPHELANVMGVAGIQYFLDAAEDLDLDLWVMLSSCVPATHMETNGGGEIVAAQLAKLKKHPRALGLAEMMNVPGVLNGDLNVMEKLHLFSGDLIDGHCPLVRGQALSAYAAAGISSCHESSEFEEAREKLSKGIAVWIREGSVAKDLKAIHPLLSLATSTSMGFCTDDRNPLDISLEGHIDHLVRRSIQYGIDPRVAYRTASWSVARHYGLGSARNRVGAIAPGFQADLVVLEDMQSCSIAQTLKKGIFTHERGSRSGAENHSFTNSIRVRVPEAVDFEGPRGRVHVIGVIEGKIITEHQIRDSSEEGVLKLSVLERHGKGSRPANGYVDGFGSALRGAIASSVGHDSHNLIVVGDHADDMRVAVAALADLGGGFCVVQRGKVLAQLSLPFGGLMSDRSPSELTQSLKDLKAASRTIGCELQEPFLQLAFLSLPVIPSLKLTDRGLVDVDAFRIIDVRAS